VYPARFNYCRPESLEEALELLKSGEDDTSVLAGGQSLVPALNLRLAQPRRVVDINRLRELDFIRADNGNVVVGALTRHKTLLASKTVQTSCPILVEAAKAIGHPQVRSLGTVGGSLAHADPAAELPCVALATGARFRARSAAGQREIAADAFFLGPLTTALRKDELLVEVAFPRLAAGSTWSFVELSRRPGDFALLGVAAVLSFDAGGRCVSARLSFAGAGPTPMRSAAAEAALVGTALAEDDLRRAADAAAEDIDPPDDALASASYRRQMARVLVPRVVRAAHQRSAAAVD
jgi:carbon-monoxide dehydrogenase medium subunit